MRIFLCLIGIALLSSCRAVYVEYDYDMKINFDSYATYNYNFIEGNDWSEFDQRRYLKYTDSVLQSKGLQVAESPDFWITTTAKSYEGSSRNTLGLGIGGGGGAVGVSVGGGIPIGVREEHLELTIDFYDSETKQYVWQAYSESSQKLNVTPSERASYFEKIISKIYSKFPPKK